MRRRPFASKAFRKTGVGRLTKLNARHRKVDETRSQPTNHGRKLPVREPLRGTLTGRHRRHDFIATRKRIWQHQRPARAGVGRGKRWLG